MISFIFKYLVLPICVIGILNGCRDESSISSPTSTSIVITKIVPDTARIGTHIAIYGNNLFLLPLPNITVLFDSIETTPDSCLPNVIYCTIPPATMSCSVKIRSSSNSYIGPYLFIVPKLLLISLDPYTPFTGELIRIYFDQLFSPEPSYYTINFNGIIVHPFYVNLSHIGLPSLPILMRQIPV